MVTLDRSLLEKNRRNDGGLSTSRGWRKAHRGKPDHQLTGAWKALEEKDEEKERLEKRFTSFEIKLDALKEDYGKFLSALQRDQLELDVLNRERGQLDPAALNEGAPTEDFG